MPETPELHEVPPLDTHRGFASGPHVNLRSALLCFALPDRKYFSPPPTLKNVPRACVRVVVMRIWFCPPPQKKKVLLITPLLPRPSHFAPPPPPPRS